MRKYIKNWFAKENIGKNIKNTLLIILGAFVLAIGSGFFLLPFSINTGGINGISMLFSQLISPDILYYVLYWSLFVIGIIFLGPKFSLSTLVATICEPIFMTIILRTGIQTWFLERILGETPELLNGVITNYQVLANGSDGLLIVMGLIGSLLVGLSSSLTFKAGASTGGIDILTFIISKYTGIKESIPYVLMDASIVTSGVVIALVRAEHALIMSSIIGILGALTAAGVVEILYSGRINNYAVDVITSKPEEICQFAITKMDRTATIFEVKGAYTKENKTMVRIVFRRREYLKVKNAIVKIDPQAFCTFYSALFVGGEGFDHLSGKNVSSIELIKEAKKKKDEQNDERVQNS